jgi:hypothetical protein
MLRIRYRMELERIGLSAVIQAFGWTSVFSCPGAGDMF